jgi:hypothetical protein
MNGRRLSDSLNERGGLSVAGLYRWFTNAEGVCKIAAQGNALGKEPLKSPEL